MFKKITAIIMTAVFIVGAFFCVPVSAVSDTSPVPVIEVPGFMASDICRNPGTENEELVFPPSGDSILAAVMHAMPGIIKFCIKGDLDILMEAVCDAMNVMLGDAFFDENGNSKENVGCSWTYPDKETVKNSEHTTFHYDWRYSPVYLSEQLHDYIEYVKKCTGSDKVSIICHSYGNSVGLTYAARYGTGSLAGYVANASAFLGETYNGEMMNGTLDIEGEAVKDFLIDNVISGNKNQDIFFALLDILDLCFIFDGVGFLADKLIEKYQDMAAREVLIPWFGHWPSVWCMIPDEYYESAKDYVFTFFESDGAGLKAELEKFDGIVRYENRNKILSSISKINFGVVARYDCQKVPVSSNYKALTDNNIDLKYASFGATCSEYGKTLPADYVQKNFTGRNYISPDRMIDASTCMFPERTWFIKNMPHADNSDDLDRLCYRIVSNKNYTVDSDPDYPMFLIYDRQDGSIVPCTNQKDNAVIAFFDEVKQIRNRILKIKGE